MMEALREGWGDDLGDAVGGQRYNTGGPASQSSRFGIIPEKHYFVIGYKGWLGRFLKHTATEKSAPDVLAEDPAEQYEVEWLDGTPDGKAVHVEPEAIWVYSAERVLAGEEQPPNTILGPDGWARDAEPAKPGELVGVFSNYPSAGRTVSKLTVLDNLQQYRELGYKLTTKNDIVPQNPEDIARQAERQRHADARRGGGGPHGTGSRSPYEG